MLRLLIGSIWLIFHQPLGVGDDKWLALTERERVEYLTGGVGSMEKLRGTLQHFHRQTTLTKEEEFPIQRGFATLKFSALLASHTFSLRQCKCQHNLRGLCLEKIKKVFIFSVPSVTIAGF